MLFIDSNIPMYLVGAEHPHKRDAQRLLEQAISVQEALVTDAEVYQEVLHRYRAIGRTDAIQPAFDLLNGIVDDVYAISVEDIESAKRILFGDKRISARDAVHIATMRSHGVSRILTFDTDFDRISDIHRVS